MSSEQKTLRKAVACHEYPGDDIAIRVTDLSKCYHIYDCPQDRLKQSIYPRLQRLAGMPPKQYHRDFWALNDISFEVKKGETVGIVGRNGSGKSTLLQIVCGTVAPTSGTIETNGRVAALLELGSGFNPEFTGRENVYLNGAVLGLNREEIDARFDSIAAFADIGLFIDQPVKTYSSGMVVRLAFSVAINVDPQILVVDEALAVGDELFQRKCFSRIESIKQLGTTILFVSHSGATVIELCNRAMLIDGGELLTIGAPKLIVGKYQKLLYAPQGDASSMRQQIRTSVIAPSGRSTSEIQPSVTSSGPKVHKSDHEDHLLETFDPNLKPESTVVYQSHGPVIKDPSIATPSGMRVNGLIPGQSYCYSYRVHFLRSATNVRFGMLIKTVSGIELGGAATAPSLSQAIPSIAAGSEARVEFNFTALLNPGTYFLNAGVMGTVDGAELYLHRILDACIFKIVPIGHTLSTGLVDFHIEPNIRITAPAAHC